MEVVVGEGFLVEVLPGIAQVVDEGLLRHGGCAEGRVAGLPHDLLIRIGHRLRRAQRVRVEIVDRGRPAGRAVQTRQQFAVEIDVVLLGAACRLLGQQFLVLAVQEAGHLPLDVLVRALVEGVVAVLTAGVFGNGVGTLIAVIHQRALHGGRTDVGQVAVGIAQLVVGPILGQPVRRTVGVGLGGAVARHAGAVAVGVIAVAAGAVAA